jgi:type IV pilus assembly protein PilW
MNIPKRYQTGFSIISSMIASAIGIFIIGGAVNVYIESKNTFIARSAIAAATENYRFAFQDMRRTLVMAGRGISPSKDSIASYTDENGDNGLRTFPAVDKVEDPDGIASGSTYVVKNSIWSPDPIDSSIVAVRYASGPAPCGLSDDILGTVVSTLTVRFLVNAEGNLICQAFQGDTELVAQPIVSGIAQMRVLYGLDQDPSIPDGVAERYLTANKITDKEWPSVVSIRIGMVVKSGDGIKLPNSLRPSKAETFDLLGDTYTAPDTKHVYKSASTTISLRNLHHVNRQNK